MSELADHYIPYESTAEAIVAADDSLEIFVLSLFPDAHQEQIAMLRTHAQAMVLEGINYGLGLSTENPMYQIEIHAVGYQQGREQGYEQAKKELQ